MDLSDLDARLAALPELDPRQFSSKQIQEFIRGAQQRLRALEARMAHLESQGWTKEDIDAVTQ